MQTIFRPRRGPSPRAGRLATALFLGGLAASAAVAVSVGGVEPVRAQSAASAIDQPTSGTLPAGTSTVRGGADARTGSGDTASSDRARTSVDVIDDGSGDGGATRPMKHLPSSMR